MTPNAESPMQQPNWFSRNWKWLLPVGCLVPMVCCGVFGFGTYFAVTKVIQSSGAYAGAMEKVNQNADVAAALGSPVMPGFGMSGEIKENNGNGKADFTVPLKGSKGSGSLHVVAQKMGPGSEWRFDSIDVEAGGKTIDVLADERNNAADTPPEEDKEPQDPVPEGG